MDIFQLLTHVYMMVSEMLCKQPRGHPYTTLWAVNELARDEVHHSVSCLLVVPHLFDYTDSVGGGLGRPRVVSGRGVLLQLFIKPFDPIAHVYSYV